MVKIYEKKAKQILVKTKIPSADYVINHYSGCSFGCIYCYAKFVCRWRDEKEKWGEFIDVKINAPELVAKESKGKAGKVFLSSVSDPYQPIERKYNLTRKVLENLNKEMELRILTKSNLVVRDIDLFKQFKNCEVGLTITTLSDEIKRKFEPSSSSPKDRLDALKELKKKGIKTYAFIGPILPYLTNLEEVFEKLSPFVDYFKFEDLNMSPCKKEVLGVIQKHFPELDERYKNLDKKFWSSVKKEIETLSKKYNKRSVIFFKSLGSLKF